MTLPDIDEVDIWNFNFCWRCSLQKLRPINFKVSSNELIFLEVFAGSGNLSEAVRHKGLLVHAIDFKTKRKTGVAIHILDLTRDSDLDVLLDMATHGNIASAHFAPPCGTASKAREKPLPGNMQDINAKPLRSASHPLGLADIGELDAKRVASANRLYAATLCIICILMCRGAAISVENPRNSYFWLVMDFFAKQHSWMQQLWNSLKDNIHQACMYGSKLDKWTTIRSTPGLYDPTCKECDRSHEHDSWKPTMSSSGPRFPTTALAEYPKELCSEMASCLAKFLLLKGVTFSDTNLNLQTSMTPRQLRVHGKKQLPPLLAEYWLVCDEPISKQFPHCKPIARLPPTCEKGGVIIVQFHGDSDGEFANQCKSLESKHATSLGTIFAATTRSDKVVKWFGILRDPSQTVKATLNVRHPMDLSVPLPDLLLRAIATVLKLGPGAVAERRVFHCNRILKRITELEQQEKEFHAGLHPQVRSVLKGKNLLMWRELLVETGYPDLEIFDEVTDGIRLVGPACESGAFPSGLTPAQQSVEQLQSQAVWRRRASIGKCRSSGDRDADVELWEQSLEEVQSGWLDGPFYDEKEVSQLVESESWICTRRFPLKQPNKIRLIDDGLESGLNSAYSCYNKLTLMDMDAVVAIANTVLRSFASKGGFEILLSTGECLTGRVHASWHNDSTMLGRTLDLKSAYKQLAVNPEQGFVRVMVAYDPVRGKPAFFIFNALPFGATGSVYSFNRVAKSLWHIMVSLGAVWATQYYDDYPNLELRTLAQSSRSFMEFILQSLGWRFAAEGKKAEPHMPCFKVLGVLLDMTESSKGKAVVSNKPERIDDLVQVLVDILDKGYLTGSEAASLHGQLNFTQGQYYGCVLKPGMVFLQKILRNGWHSEYQQELATVVAYIVSALRSCPPRVIKVTDETRPMLAFTDGAYEPCEGGAVASAGLVLVDGANSFRTVREVAVPSELIQHWSREGAKQLIVYLELWPILVFLSHYGSFLRNRRVVVFIDNNAVRDALIKGSSPICDIFCMLALCSHYVSSYSLCPWFTRVASESNPGDDPSRGQSRRMAALLGAAHEAPLEASGSLVSSITSIESFLDFMEESSRSGHEVQLSENGGGGASCNGDTITEQGHNEMEER